MIVRAPVAILMFANSMPKSSEARTPIVAATRSRRRLGEVRMREEEGCAPPGRSRAPWRGGAAGALRTVAAVQLVARKLRTDKAHSEVVTALLPRRSAPGRLDIAALGVLALLDRVQRILSWSRNLRALRLGSRLIEVHTAVWTMIEPRASHRHSDVHGNGRTKSR